MQVHKSTADLEGGAALYARYTSLPDAWLPLRALVIAKRKPRQMFVQARPRSGEPLGPPPPPLLCRPCLDLLQPVLEPVGDGTDPDGCSTIVRGGETQKRVQLRTFPATLEGMLAAFVHRWPRDDPEFLALWEAEREVHAREPTALALEAAPGSLIA